MGLCGVELGEYRWSTLTRCCGECDVAACRNQRRTSTSRTLRDRLARRPGSLRDGIERTLAILPKSLRADVMRASLQELQSRLGLAAQ